MTGIEHLRRLASNYETYSRIEKIAKIDLMCVSQRLSKIADQIEREEKAPFSRMRVLSVISEMERHVLGHEGMDDSPVARWARELREALGGRGHDLPEDEREAIAWVCEHGGLDAVNDGLDAVNRSLQDAENKRVELYSALGVDTETGWADAMTEMRRRLMPEGMEWPRFEGGEPVPLGGEVTVAVHDEDGDFDRTLAIRSIKYKETGVVLEGTGNEMVIILHGERVKRPAPKVLDADGVEIRVGDTVYEVDTGEKMWVSALPKPGEYQCAKLRLTNGMFKTLDPCRFTHRAPVLAADGKPLREGETVWDTKGNGLYSIEKIEADGTVRISGTDLDYFGNDFVHERLDSFELIEQDVELCPHDYAQKYDKPSGMSNAKFQRKDLVRRAKALAGSDT